MSSPAMQHLFPSKTASRPYEPKTQQKDESLEMSLREHLLAAAHASSHPGSNQTMLVSSQAMLEPDQTVLAPSNGPLASVPVNVQSVGVHSVGIQGVSVPQVDSVSATTLPSPSDHGSGESVTGHLDDYTVSAHDSVILHSRTSRAQVVRPLATTKRAAQNRAAQRAFRQRKEEYIRALKVRMDDLEREVASFHRMKMQMSDLKDYAFVLQSKLLAILGECPAPPPTVDLAAPATLDSSFSAPPPPPPPPPEQIEDTTAEVAHMVPMAEMVPVSRTLGEALVSKSAVSPADSLGYQSLVDALTKANKAEVALGRHGG